MPIADPALVLVDMQKDFCAPGFAHDEPDADMASIRSAVEAAGDFLDRYRASGRTPILVRTVHDDASTSPRWVQKYGDRPTPCRPDAEGAEFAPELGVRESDVVVTKHRYNAFHETDLDTYLRSAGVGRVLIGGVATNVCVEGTVRGAFDRDYDVALLADCTASTEPDLREASLRNVDAHFGEVIERDAVELSPLDDGDQTRPAASEAE